MMITTGYKTKPDLRFPMFLDDWSYLPLRELAEKKIKKNKNGKFSNVYTNSAIKGVIAQQDYFSKDIANQENLTGYYIVEKNDFVYNPRISVSAPVGPIKRNHLKTGVMSPLYTIFELRKSQYTNFLEFYFENCSWHRYMCSVANYGARHDRMNISSSDFFNLPIALPISDEARKIANFLSSIDKKTQQLTEKQSLLQQYKKGIMQKLFSQEIRFKDEQGNDFPYWDLIRLSEILELQDNSIKMDDKMEYELITVRRRNGGVDSRGCFKGKEVLVKNQFKLNSKQFVISKRQIVHGACGLVPEHLEGAIVSNEYNVFEPVESRLDIEYFNIFATTLLMRKAFFINSDGVHIEKLLFKTRSWLKTKILLPNKNEQQKIVSFISVLDKKIELVSQQIKQTKTFKKGLLQQMFV